MNTIVQKQHKTEDGIVRREFLIGAFEDILDRKIALLKDNIATKDCIRDLKGIIKDQKDCVDGKVHKTP